MGIELRWSCLEAGICTHLSVLPTSDFFIFFSNMVSDIGHIPFLCFLCMTKHERTVSDNDCAEETVFVGEMVSSVAQAGLELMILPLQLSEC